jgi:hypothetical protein
MLGLNTGGLKLCVLYKLLRVPGPQHLIFTLEKRKGWELYNC